MNKKKESKKEILKDAIDNFNIDDIEEALKEGEKLSEEEKKEAIKNSVSVDELKEEDIIVIEKTEDEIEKMSEKEVEVEIEKSVKKSKKESEEEIKDISIEKISLNDVKKVEEKEVEFENKSMFRIKVKNQHHGRIVITENYNDGKKDRKRVYSILLREHISVDEIDSRIIKLVKKEVGENNVEIIK